MPIPPPDRLHRSAIAALAVLTLIWLIFALLSGAEGQGGGLTGVIRNSPNALPWVAVLALVWAAHRWPLAGGLAIVAMAFATMVGFDTWHHPMSFALITLPYLVLGGLVILAAMRR